MRMDVRHGFFHYNALNLVEGSGVCMIQQLDAKKRRKWVLDGGQIDQHLIETVD